MKTMERYFKILSFKEINELQFSEESIYKMRCLNGWKIGVVNLIIQKNQSQKRK